MWYNTHALNTSEKKLEPQCHDCGCALILVEVATFTVGNNPSPITKTTYRCPNKECQEESDKRAAKRLELRLEQEQARENRKKKATSITLKAA